MKKILLTIAVVFLCNNLLAQKSPDLKKYPDVKNIKSNAPATIVCVKWKNDKILSPESSANYLLNKTEKGDVVLAKCFSTLNLKLDKKTPVSAFIQSLDKKDGFAVMSTHPKVVYGNELSQLDIK